MTIANELEAIMAGMARAYSAGDAAGCAALFSETAQLHSSFAPPAVGRAAIEALHDDWLREPTSKRFDLVESGGSGDLAWGLFRFAEGHATGQGSSLAVFTRINGEWRITACCLHGDTAESSAD